MTTRELSHESQFVTSQQISNSFSAAHSSRHGSVGNFFFRAQPPAPNFCQVIATRPAAAASISSRPATFSSAKPPKTFKLFHGWNPRKAFKTFVNFLKLTENSFILQEKMENMANEGKQPAPGRGRKENLQHSGPTTQPFTKRSARLHQIKVESIGPTRWPASPKKKKQTHNQTNQLISGSTNNKILQKILKSRTAADNSAPST